MKVVILRGLPGSGKSTYARTIHCNKVSADDYFYQNGIYRFDATKLQQAHGACLLKFIDFIRARNTLENEIVVVDNTNIRVTEIAPYVAIAQAYNATVKIVEFDCDVETSVARNKHQVPREKIEKMQADMQYHTTLIPPWWCRIVISKSCDTVAV